MKVLSRNICISQIGDDEVDHRDRPADENVAFGDVRDELPQVGRREQVTPPGAGVVADSVPEREQVECVSKARALFKAADEAVRFATRAKRGQ